jgi:Lipocalin-like domain
MVDVVLSSTPVFRRTTIPTLREAPLGGRTLGVCLRRPRNASGERHDQRFRGSAGNGKHLTPVPPHSAAETGCPPSYHRQWLPAGGLKGPQRARGTYSARWTGSRRSSAHVVGSLAAIAVLGGWTRAANAADLDPAGVWMVVSYTARDQQTGVTAFPFGEQPTGSVIYTPTGHMSILVTARERVLPKGTRAESRAARASLLDSMYAYSGTFTMKGETVTIHIESAWQPSWVGTDKVRTMRIDGAFLTITTPPMSSPVDGRMYISVTRFKRAR